MTWSRTLRHKRGTAARSRRSRQTPGKDRRSGPREKECDHQENQPSGPTNVGRQQEAAACVLVHTHLWDRAQQVKREGQYPSGQQEQKGRHHRRPVPPDLRRRDHVQCGNEAGSGSHCRPAPRADVNSHQHASHDNTLKNNDTGACQERADAPGTTEPASPSLVRASQMIAARRPTSTTACTPKLRTSESVSFAANRTAVNVTRRVAAATNRRGPLDASRKRTAGSNAAVAAAARQRASLSRR